jgi:hypothetical protein
MFATNLDLFSIGTIIVPIHIESISKLVFILDINITKLVPKQCVELVCVLANNLTIPPDIVKQHLLEAFFHQEVGEMIIDETHVWEQIQDLTIVNWTETGDEQLTKVNLGTRRMCN